MLTIKSSEFQRGKTGTPFLRQVMVEGQGEVHALNGRGSNTTLRSIRLTYEANHKGESISMRDFKSKGGVKSMIDLIEAGTTHVRAEVDGVSRVFFLEVLSS